MVEERKDGDSVKRIYSSGMHWVNEADWEQMSLAERRVVSRQIVRVVTGELDRAVESDTFDARIDRHLSRTPFILDEQGWSEMMKIHLDAFLASVEVRDRAEERLKRSGEEGIRGRSVQVLFEVPKP
jgi:hypothetical protein